MLELTPNLLKTLKENYNKIPPDKMILTISLEEYICKEWERIQDIHKSKNIYHIDMDKLEKKFHQDQKELRQELYKYQDSCWHEIVQHYADIYERSTECLICGKQLR